MWDSFYKSAVKGFGCVVGISGAFAFLLLIFALTTANSKAFIHSVQGIVWLDSEATPKLSTLDQQALRRLMNNGAVIPPENILSHTMAYYDTIIVVLVSLLGVMGIVAFMYARGLSRDHAEKEAERATKNFVQHYFESKPFLKDLSDNTEVQVKVLLQDYPLDELMDTAARLDEIDERLEAVESAINFEDEIPAPPTPPNTTGQA